MLFCAVAICLCGADPEPLKNAWSTFILPIDKAAEFRSLTTAQRWAVQMKAVESARKESKNKTYSLRISLTDVDEPTRDKDTLTVHAEYADEEYRKVFGSAEIVFQTDVATAAQIKIGDELELHGKIVIGGGIGETRTNPKDTHTLVAVFKREATGWTREAWIHMVNPKLARPLPSLDK